VVKFGGNNMTEAKEWVRKRANMKLSEMDSNSLIEHRESCLIDIYDGKGIYVSDEDFEHKEKMFRQVAICERILKERQIDMKKHFNQIQHEAYKSHHKYFSRYSKKDIITFYEKIVGLGLPMSPVKMEAFFDVAREKGIPVEPSQPQEPIDFNEVTKAYEKFRNDMTKLWNDNSHRTTV